jgi:hypothetical protein
LRMPECAGIVGIMPARQTGQSCRHAHRQVKRTDGQAGRRRVGRDRQRKRDGYTGGTVCGVSVGE